MSTTRPSYEAAPPRLALPIALAGAALLAVCAVACSDDNGGPGDAAQDHAPLEASADSADLGVDGTVPQPTITALVPDNGLACPPPSCNGVIPVTIVGENFTNDMVIYVDGGAAYILNPTTVNVPTTIVFNLPKQPYNETEPYRAEISVGVGTARSNVMNFQYHVTKNAEDGFQGRIETASRQVFRDFGFPEEDAITGLVKISGKTDTTDGSAPAQLVAQIGFGEVGSDPQTSIDWFWYPASYLEDADDVDDAYDRFQATFVPPRAGTFDLAMRFSDDNGRHWVYADLDDNDLTYAPADAAELEVTMAPQHFCLETADCVDKWRVVCRPGASWKDNVCVECLQASDCTGNPDALGPKCSGNLCGCDGDPDCASNENGHKCLAGNPKYCGCESPADCSEPDVCYEDHPFPPLTGCDPPQ